MLQKVKLKLVTVNVVLLIVSLAAVLVSVYFLFEGQLKEQERALLEKVAYKESLKPPDFTKKNQNNDSGIEGYIENEENHLVDISLKMFYIKCDSGGSIISISSANIIHKPEDMLYLIDKVESMGRQFGQVNLTNYIHLSFLISDINNTGGKIYIFVDRSNREETMSAYIKTAFITFFNLIACAFFVSVYMAGRSIKPIKESMERQDKFIEDASHELRTPIAVIRSNVEIIMDSPEQTVGENMKWLEYIFKEAKRMTEMTEDLLLLSRAESKRESVKEEINLSVTVSEVFDSFSHLLAENNLSADSSDIAPDVYICANDLGIRQLVSILLDNAIKYTKEGGIKIKLEKDENFAYIKVIDTGIGISGETGEKIFERFFRVDKARSRTSATGGSGLGLSIAKAIADDHGGEITVESEPGKGSEFCVKLPLKN